MLFENENGMRDYIFNDYRGTFASLIRGRREPFAWTKVGFPPLRHLIRHRVEQSINQIVDSLGTLELQGKQFRLSMSNDSTTRIELLGTIIEGLGLTIIDIKK
jgi:hypothetical protein